MTAELRAADDEVKHPRRCINDLIGLVTLPAIWSGGAPADIGGTLLDVLLRVLHLDFAYARLSESIDGTPSEMVRLTASRRVAIRPEEIREAFSVWLADGPPQWSSRVPNPFGAGDIGVLPFRLGPHGEMGVIVTGSERADSPNETERATSLVRLTA